jgi:hypothetical protein
LDGAHWGTVSGNSNSVKHYFWFNDTRRGYGMRDSGWFMRQFQYRPLQGVGNGKPNVPGNISGPAAGQCGQTGVGYSIAPVINPVAATSYSWSASGGATVNGPSNLSSTSIDFPASFSSVTVSVTANNACGSSNPRTLAVSGSPSIPSQITGSTNVCAGTLKLTRRLDHSGQRPIYGHILLLQHYFPDKAQVHSQSCGAPPVETCK